MSTNRDCPICGSGEHKLLFSQHFTGISSGSLLDGYDVVACQNCGFCFASSIPEQSMFNQYYRDLSKYEHQGLMNELSEYDISRYSKSAQLLSEFVEDKQARILDVGCSTGGLLNALKQVGYKNLHGLEPSPLCARLARQRYDVEVFTGSLSDLPAPPSSYDLIILGSVIEHIRDLKSALTQLRVLLSPNGLVYIDAPDATRFGETTEAPFQEFSTEHINYFSPITLINLMEEIGFVKIHLLQTSVEPNPGKVVCEIKGLFVKRKKAGVFSPEQDHETEKAMTKYISDSVLVEEQIHQVINQIASDGTPILIWGVGSHTQRLLATSQLSHANIQVFIDSNPRYQGKTLLGKPIISPNDVRNYDNPILIASRGYQKEIDNIIKKVLELPNKVIYLYHI